MLGWPRFDDSLFRKQLIFLFPTQIKTILLISKDFAVSYCSVIVTVVSVLAGIRNVKQSGVKQLQLHQLVLIE